MVQQITHFFQHYKDLEKGKWVNVVRWGEADEAAQLISQGIAAYRDAETEASPDI